MHNKKQPNLNTTLQKFHNYKHSVSFDQRITLIGY